MGEGSGKERGWDKRKWKRKRGIKGRNGEDKRIGQEKGVRR